MGEFKTRKVLYGVGSRIGDAPVRFNGKNNFEYRTWANMLKRCYSKISLKDNPSYIDCTVCEEWLVYENFYSWVTSVNRKEGWHLDKDLLAKGNKEYSPDTCVFLPPNLNKLLIKTWVHRDGMPPGVFYDSDRSKYKSTVKLTINGVKNISIKRFSTLVEAAENYKHEKELSIRYVAEQYRGVIDDRAYSALINFKIEPTWRKEK